MGNRVESTAEARIRAVLAGVADPEIRIVFIERYQSSLEEFVNSMAEAHRRWEKLDSTIEGSEERAHISSLVYGVINNQVVSMKLLLMGLLVPAGNTQRHVLEGIALALLASRRDIGVRQKYMEAKCSTHKAITHIKRHAARLGLIPEALEQLERASKAYDQFSHPSLMTVAHSMFLDGSAGLVLGGFFDEGKLAAYDKEVQSRVSLACTFCNFIDAVEHNLMQDRV
jgi:hypothetical protein